MTPSPVTATRRIRRRPWARNDEIQALFEGEEDFNGVERVDLNIGELGINRDVFDGDAFAVGDGLKDDLVDVAGH